MLIPASVIVTEPGSYKEFVQHTLKVHNNTPLTNHMGLETMIVHDWDGRMRFTRNDNLDDPFKEWKDGRLERLRKLKPVFLLTIAGVGALDGLGATPHQAALGRTGPQLAAVRRDDESDLLLLFDVHDRTGAGAGAARRSVRSCSRVAGASVVIGAMGTANKLYYWIDDNYAAQSWLFFLGGLLMLYAYSRPFSMERLQGVVGRKAGTADEVRATDLVASAGAGGVRRRGRGGRERVAWAASAERVGVGVRVGVRVGGGACAGGGVGRAWLT